ncbi:MAG: transposase [bacterium]
MVYKKKLHLLNPNKKPQEIEIHQTKRNRKTLKVTAQSLERQVREYLSRKLSSIYLGLWLLVPEHLRLGSWDLLKMWSRSEDKDLKPRLALQMVNESALCVNGQRPVRSVSHQGFELLNGLPFLASDVSIHQLLNEHTIKEAKQLQQALGKLRLSREHYSKEGLFAFDPHRIHSYTKRIMPAKKKDRSSKSEKVMQTFFCIDAITGQPISFRIGCSSTTTSKATIELMAMVKSILPYNGIAMADSEHVTAAIINEFAEDEQIDIIMPMPMTRKIKQIIEAISYQRKWAGYALGETTYEMSGVSYPIELVVQRTSEINNEYKYKAFAVTGRKDRLKLLSEDYPERWRVEEFFNFEAAMGWNRASTMNLNIRYGKMSLALIAQAATYQLRQKLPKPYKNWTAKHLADSIFRGIEGDLRVKDDTIIVTFYDFPENLNIKDYYENLPKKLISEGIDPRVPWLYNFKLDFKFK